MGSIPIYQYEYKPFKLQSGAKKKNLKQRQSEHKRRNTKLKLNAKGIILLWKICDNIRQTRQSPNHWSTSTFIRLLKKGSSQKCNNFRTVALISHPSKA